MFNSSVPWVGTCLLHNWHGHGCLGVGYILTLPQLGYRLDLGAELDSLLAVEVGVSTEWATGASEWEHGKGYWDGNIDTDLYKKRWKQRKEI